MILSIMLGSGWGVAILCGVFVILFSILELANLCRAPRRMWPSPIADPFTKFLLRSFGGTALDVGVRVGEFWLGISLITNILVPYMESGVSFLTRPHEFIQAINYTIVVPILYGLYAYFVTALSEILKPSKVKQLGLHYVENPRLTLRSDLSIQAVAMILLSVAATFIGWSITCHILGRNQGLELIQTWVQGHRLTIAGILYYSMRGINAFIVLGLATSITSGAWILYRHLACGPQPRLIALDFSVDKNVLPIGRCLIWIAVAGALVILFELSAELTYIGGVWRLAHPDLPGTVEEALKLVRHWVSPLIGFWIIVFPVGASL
ncbi:MAG TPA: hypothetical protein VKE92_03510, partial [Anaerolineales bacterium]|nr:hypothetical protein [Anaerolineales bacterium]